MQLYIGNKNYSSWSMRPWVLMKQAGIAVRGGQAALRCFDADSHVQAAAGRRHARPAGCRCWSTTASPSGTRWRSPNTWPRSSRTSRSGRRERWRAPARAACAPRCTPGFGALRNHCGDEHRGLAAGGRRTAAARAARGARRPRAHRAACGAGSSRRSGGPLLFGAFSIADAYFAPVVHRASRTYGAAGAAADRRPTSSACCALPGDARRGSTTRWPRQRLPAVRRAVPHARR